jgi:hypothetical protein
MIEGVNASIASAALVRPAVDQVERVASYAANPTQVQRVAAPPYLSLNVAMNYTIDKAVLQFRDAESGEVLSQIPSEKQIKAYRRAATQQPVIFEQKADTVEAQAAVVSSSAPSEPSADIPVVSASPSSGGTSEPAGGDTTSGSGASAPVEITA